MLAPRETLVVKESTSRSMRANRSKDTTLEVTFRKALWRAGIRGYRKHVRSLPGSPDLCFSSKRVAVFMHGCYWHRCPVCKKDAPLKTNVEFWRSKLEASVERDVRSRERLEALGYHVLIIWECEVRKNLESCVERVRTAVAKPQ
ncbi:very short patch repair endonuclease [Fimbriimonas ginsengisoli]|uniref:very short patch repair endonuclease n=1 Tax=Fimbriimonas ginsengisoli TaxID=1005039 RepID=UPI0005717606|nr:very short patch repair endonuclease [Fimbriimonas ginsengisoli]